MKADLVVEEADAADEKIVGFVQEEPRWFGVGKLPWTASGPTTDLRHVPIELIGGFVREVDMGVTSPANALAVGDSVTKDSATQHAWTQHETSGVKKLNFTHVLKAGAPSGKSIVVFNYTGDSGVEL